MTFRVVSDKSDPMSWTHPGSTAKDFSSVAMQNMDWQSILASSKNNFLESMGL